MNNAGYFGAFETPVEKLTLRQWQRTLDVNLTGALLFAKHAARHLRKSRGAIINITSTRATMSEPDTEAYAASKGGLSALTHALAISLGPEVRVNAIAAGWIATAPGSRARNAKRPSSAPRITSNIRQGASAGPRTSPSARCTSHPTPQPS